MSQHAGGTSTVRHLRATLVAALDAVIPRSSSVALIDFPRHSNIGDSAIWLGELAYLRARGCSVRYACDWSGYDPDVLRDALEPGSVVLLHGGGNFGDLYRRHQDLRERVLRDVPDRVVVQLPQTVQFQQPGALDAFVEEFGQLERFHVLVRDRASRAALDGRLRRAPVLCPDSAFMLTPLRRRGPRAPGVVHLLRTDHESRTHDAGSVGQDWLQAQPQPSARALDQAARWLAAAERRLPAGPGRSSSGRLVRASYRRRAALELRRGVDLLTAGDVVITDRLHAHILCLLHDVPHVVLDDANSKVSGFSDLWIGEHRLVRRASSLREAASLAEQLAAGR